MARKVSWSALKDRQTRLSLPFDWVEESDYYIVKIFTLNDDFETILGKGDDSDSDTTDFETNYKNSPQTIGSAGDRLKVTADISAITTSGFPCPTISGDKWRTEVSTTDIGLSTGSYTTLKSLSNGVLQSFILDFSTDRVDVKVTIDGQDIFNLDLDDLEDSQTGSSSNGANGVGGITYVKTGSKFCFNPPCGLTYSNLTISAQAEQNNKKLSGYLIHYTVA